MHLFHAVRHIARSTRRVRCVPNSPAVRLDRWPSLRATYRHCVELSRTGRHNPTPAGRSGLIQQHDNILSVRKQACAKRLYCMSGIEAAIQCEISPSASFILGVVKRAWVLELTIIVSTLSQNLPNSYLF